MPQKALFAVKANSAASIAVTSSSWLHAAMVISNKKKMAKSTVPEKKQQASYPFPIMPEFKIKKEMLLYIQCSFLSESISSCSIIIIIYESTSRRFFGESVRRIVCIMTSIIHH